MGPCIFCFRSNPEVTFNKEHLIPDSLGGMLILNDYVCSECNSKFGSKFDHEILKNPEILAALKKLELSHDRIKLINHNYKIHGCSNGIELRGKATKDGFIFNPQSLPDGSMIYPEKDYKKSLLKSIRRAQRLNDAGLMANQIKAEFNKLTKAYDQARVGEKIESSTLGVVLFKRSDAFNISLVPKGSGNVSRLIAKIAYEFGFTIGYSDFLKSEYVAKPLHKFIETGECQPGFHVFRTGTELPDYAPVHFISFQCYDCLTRVVVGFFGKIAYTLIAPPFENKVLSQIAETYECPKIVGVEYQQDMAKDTVGFWALLPEKSVMYIGP